MQRTYRHRFARAAPAPRAKRKDSKNRGRASPVNELNVSCKCKCNIKHAKWAFVVVLNRSPQFFSKFSNHYQVQISVGKYESTYFLTGDARPRFFESSILRHYCLVPPGSREATREARGAQQRHYALLEEQVRRARSDDGRL